MQKSLSQRYEDKCTGSVGPGCDRPECSFLNRVNNNMARGTVGGAQIELGADARHVEVAFDELGLRSRLSLNPCDHFHCGAVREGVVVATAGPDTPDSFPKRVDEDVLRDAGPRGLDRGCEVVETAHVSLSSADLQRLKRLVRFLLRRPRVLHVLRPPFMGGSYLFVEKDADLVGDYLASSCPSELSP